MRFFAAIAAVALLPGCSTLLGIEEREFADSDASNSGPTADAAEDVADASTPDAAVPVCASFSDWSTPSLVEELAIMESQSGLTLSPDERTAYFTLLTSQFEFQMYKAVRADSSSPFSTPQPVAALSGAGGFTHPKMSPNGLELFLQGGVCNATPTMDIFVATRDTLLDEFGGPTAIASINSPDCESRPMLAEDGLTLLFSSNRPGGVGALDIWEAKRNSLEDDFAVVGTHPELNSDRPDEGAFLFRENTIYFQSLRDNVTPRLMRADRPSPSEDFSTPIVVPEFIDYTGAGHPWITRDGLTIFFTSEIGGTRQIYEATRTCLD